MMSSFTSESESEMRTKAGKDQKSSCSSRKSFKHHHRFHRHRKVYIKTIKPLEKTWLTAIIVLTQFSVTVLMFGMLIFQKEYYHVSYLESINPSLIICVIFQMIISFFLGCAYCLSVKLGAAMGIAACIVASFTEAAVVFYLTFADLILSHCYETPCTFIKGNYQERMGFAATLGIFSFLHFLFAVCYVLDGTRKPQVVKTPLKKKSKSSRASESSQKSRSRRSTLSTSEVVKKRAKDGCPGSIKISRRTISQSSQIDDSVLQKRSKTTKLEKFIPISYPNPSQTSEKSTSWTTNFSGPSNISHAVCNTPTCPRYSPQIFVSNPIVQTPNSIVNFGTKNDQNRSIIINLPQNIENEQEIVEIQRVIVHLPKQ